MYVYVNISYRDDHRLSMMNRMLFPKAEEFSKRIEVVTIHTSRAKNVVRSGFPLGVSSCQLQGEIRGGFSLYIY